MARDIFRLYRAADTLDYMNRVDASAALQQVKGRIHKHRHRISWMVWGQRIAACMALPLLATTLYLILKNPPQEYVEIRTNPGMVAEANLPDGTKVWLNSGSSLKHPVKFTGDTRTVELDGRLTSLSVKTGVNGLWSILLSIYRPKYWVRSSIWKHTGRIV